MKQQSKGHSLLLKGVATIAILGALVVTPGIASAAKDGGSSAGAPDINAQPVAKLKKGGTFVWATTQICDNYNTNHSDGNFAGCSYLMNGLLPGTFYPDEKGAFQIDKNYFTDIKLTSTKPQTLTYTVNPNPAEMHGDSVRLSISVMVPEKGIQKKVKMRDFCFKSSSSSFRSVSSARSNSLF